MGEGYFEKLQRQVQLNNSSWILLVGIIVGALGWALANYTSLNIIIIAVIILFVWAFASIAVGMYTAKKSLKPLQHLSQAILHISPSEHLVAAPNMDDLKLGKELIENLTRQVYEFASTNHVAAAETKTNNLTDQLPIPVIGLSEEGKIVSANRAVQAFSIPGKTLAGAFFEDVIDMEFISEDTLESWVKAQQTSSVSASKIWERVKINVGEEIKYVDLAAQFSKHNQSGIETSIIMFDHTRSYQVDDDSLSFIALAVHELRTPLTALRGYIEVFQDEIGPNLDSEHADFMRKMEASAESLTGFVSNILNVARVDQNQLTLKLVQTDWKQCLEKATSNMRLRAQVRSLALEVNIAPNLPLVAADPITVVEVINNLVENAIKYSRQDSGKIIISSQLTKDGLVETTVQDFGLGIPASVTGELFKRFSRNFRTRSSVSGTGLGLFLSKAIVSAHGGNIWVKSTEGQGSTFGFTLQPFDKVATNGQNGDNSNITRTANGWIKNHSMYRR